MPPILPRARHFSVDAAAITYAATMLLFVIITLFSPACQLLFAITLTLHCYLFFYAAVCLRYAIAAVFCLYAELRC